MKSTLGNVAEIEKRLRRDNDYSSVFVMYTPPEAIFFGVSKFVIVDFLMFFIENNHVFMSFTPPPLMSASVSIGPTPRPKCQHWLDPSPPQPPAMLTSYRKAP